MQVDKDLVIIGGGTAGLSAAQYAARSNLDVLLIEGMSNGGQALIIDDLENYPGFPEPIKGYEFIMRMDQQARKFGAELSTDSIESVEKKDGIFYVQSKKKTLKAYSVIVATGAKHRKLGIPGEDEFSGKGVSYCATCDGPFFRNKKILVVGGGDAAMDEAMFLSKLTDKLVVIHRRDRFRAQPALADRVLNNKSIDIRFNSVLKEIKGTDKVNEVIIEKTDTNEQYSENFDAVFIFVGSMPQTAAVDYLEKDDGGYILTDQRMESSEKGLFIAGDLRVTPFRQIVVAASDGAIAAHCAAQYIDDIKGQAYI